MLYDIAFMCHCMKKSNSLFSKPGSFQKKKIFIQMKYILF